MVEFYNKKLDFVFSELGTSENGLSTSEMMDRVHKYGKNELKQKEEVSKFKIFLAQFKDKLVWILIAALLISLLIAIFEYNLDALIVAGLVLIVIFLNLIFGFLRELKTEKAIDALNDLGSLKTIVFRDGEEKEIDASELVPGDVILLTPGERIPADARLIEAKALQTQELALTGESNPVNKDTNTLSGKFSVADRTNMVFSGTTILQGTGKAVVTRIGMQTEIGKLAGLIEKTKIQSTRLQRNWNKFGKAVDILVLAASAVIFAIGVLRGLSLSTMFLSAVVLALAAVPASLSLVITTTLALGVRRMFKRNVVIRRLPSVEALGSTTVICSDKTGIFTKNEMTVQKLFVDGKIISVTGLGYETKGSFSEKTKDLQQLLTVGALCNDANVANGKVFGDPTEASLIVSAAKFGLDKTKLEHENPRLDEIPFTVERKRMTTVHQFGKRKFSFTKGAPDVILHRCHQILENGKVRYLTPRDKQKILAANDELGKQAYKILAFAFKEMKDDNKPAESNLVFIGLQGIIDPPRQDAIVAVNKCRDAGVKVIMITGDHKITARAIAEQLGISGKAITGEDLDKMDDKILAKKIEDIAVYARVNPDHKVRIVNALKKSGNVVAMTGDGIHDAPSLKKADIGIAMGIGGTEVAKEASDMIIRDDNFASIVGAVEEGRGIFDNIRKTIEYLITCNMGQFLIVFLAILFGFPLPLIAIQVLFMNLLIAGLPALTLGVEREEPGIMSRGPRKLSKNIVSKRAFFRMSYLGAIMMIGTLWLFKYYRPETDLLLAQTIAFTTLTFYYLFHALNSRSINNSFFKIGIFKNIFLWLAIIVSIGLQFAILYIPALNFIFKTTPLSWTEWAYVILVSSSIFIIREVIKAINLAKK